MHLNSTFELSKQMEDKLKDLAKKPVREEIKRSIAQKIKGVNKPFNK